MQQVVEVLAPGVRRGILIPLRGVMGILQPLLFKWAFFYVVGFKIHIMLEEE